MTNNTPESYNTLDLPGLLLSHHPRSSPTPTPIIIIALHRPAARNAFTNGLGSSLIQAYDLLSQDPRVKCIVLTSSDQSNRMFCAGMDFNAGDGAIGGTVDTHRDSGGRVALSMFRCHKPIVAAINGSAVGVGITMCLSADIRIASSRARIGFVFSRRGFNMEACSSFFLPRLVGMSRALHLTTTGSVVPASDKLLEGLFSQVVPPEEVLPAALRVAEDIAGNVSIVAARLMRDLMYRGAGNPEEAHLLESRVFYDMYRSKDAKEGIDSFMEKRAPDFQAKIEQDGPRAWPWWKPVDVGPWMPKL